MDSLYQPIPDEDHTKTTLESFLKQGLICSAVWMQYFLAGLAVGAPTVILPQLRAEVNSTGEVITDELGSWLYAAPPISALPWIVIVPLLTKKVGRKIPQIITCFVAMLSFIILYCSSTLYHILISELVQGYLHAGNLTLTILSITEYSSPRLRGFFLTVCAAGFYWGLWIANAIGTFFHWKNIALIGICSSFYCLTIIFWPESPYWLASKGRIDDSRKAFRWMHGQESRENELKELILAQEKNLALEKTEGNMTFFETMQCPEFSKPMLLSILVHLQYLFSGKLICCLYILDIFKSITSSEESAYMAMLILDGITLFCLYTGTYLAKIMKRRTLYLSSSFVCVFFLLSLSLYLFLVRLNLYEVNNYLVLALLTAFSVSISVGPMILSGALYGELISLRFQAISYIIIALTISVTYFTWLILMPRIFAVFGLDGSFLLYGLTCGLCTFVLYFYLPETKDKTRWEIDNLFVKRKSSQENVLEVIDCKT